MDGDVWDEERWEAFLKENDRRVEYFMSVLFRFMTEHPPAGPRGSAARREWEAKFRTYLASNGINPDDVLPRDFPASGADSGPSSQDEDLSSRSDFDPPETLFQVNPSQLFEEDDDGPLDDVRSLPEYVSAHHLAVQVLRWTNSLPGHVKDSTLVQFCSFVMQIPANLAKGHEFGYERDTIGGNIACAKRALSAANAALELLPEIRTASYMDRSRYRALYEANYECRNQIALYVLDLRARFDLGID